MRSGPIPRLELIVLLSVVAFTELTITRGLEGGNQWSRMSLVFSIVERGRLDIDGWTSRTPDWSRVGGHFYSSKAPGPALLAVPAYFAQHAIQRLVGIDDDAVMARHVAAYLAVVVTGVVPTLIALALLIGLLRDHFGLGTGESLALAATWAGGSLALPYGTLFFGHQSAAAFSCIGIALAIGELDRGDDARPRRLAAAGAALAFTVACDYGTLPSVALWSIWIAWQLRRPRLIGACLVGGLGPALIVMAYHAACFGSPFVTAYDPRFLSPEWVGAMRFDGPRLSRLIAVTLLPRRGWFYCTPVYALTLLSPWWARDHLSRRSELLVAGLSVTLSLALLVSTPDWRGGWCIGPRFLTAQLPAATLLLIPALRRVPRAFALAAIVSGLLMLAATLVDPLQMDIWSNPFRKPIWPALIDDRPTPVHNLLGELFGLPRRFAFIGYALVWSAAALWLRGRVAAQSTAPAEASSARSRSRAATALATR